MVSAARVRVLSGPKAVTTPTAGGVVYWMSRDQRAHDNWALLHAQDVARRHKVGLSVIFCLVPTFHEATIRQYGFMLRGLQEVERDLRDLGIPFKVLSGNPVDEVPSFLRRHEGCALVTDFSPLRTGRAWKSAVGEKLSSTPFYEVDAHNIVPVWVASDKQEVGARTIRKKINDKLPTWLKDFPPLEPQPVEPPQHAQAVAAPLPAEDASGIIPPVPPAPSTTSVLTSVMDEGMLRSLSAQLEAAVVASPLDLATAERVLGQLEGVRIDRALLKASGVGKAANDLAKAKCDLSTRARTLVDLWKAAVSAEKAAATAGATPATTTAGAAAAGSSGSARSLALPRHPSASLLGECVAPTDWTALEKSLVIDRNVKQVDWLLPGPAAAREAVHAFCASRLALFADKRNDPNVHALSDLSPYLHFGQLSAQRMALLVQAAVAAKPQAALQAGLESFLEESIVRRELSDNFCFYNPNYDNLNGAAGWARESLELHAADKREHVYTLKQLEEAQTHEDIWNAAQRQMARTGKMHGFMRACTGPRRFSSGSPIQSRPSGGPSTSTTVTPSTGATRTGTWAAAGRSWACTTWGGPSVPYLARSVI